MSFIISYRVVQVIEIFELSRCSRYGGVRIIEVIELLRCSSYRGVRVIGVIEVIEVFELLIMFELFIFVMENCIFYEYFVVGKGMEFIPLVDFIFETNPLAKPDIDQCITAVCQPLEIIYDAVGTLMQFTLA